MEKKTCVRCLRGLGREENAHGRVLFAIKPLFRRPRQGGRALGSSVALWIVKLFLRSAPGGESLSEDVGLGGCVWMGSPVSHWGEPAGDTWDRWWHCCPEEFPRTESQDHLGWKTPPRSWSPAVRTAQDVWLGEHRIDCLRASEVMLTSSGCSSNEIHLFYLESTFQRKNK